MRILAKLTAKLTRRPAWGARGWQAKGWQAAQLA